MLSRITYIACAVLMLYASFFLYPRFNTGTAHVFTWDAGTYYWYLPSVFIYKDLKQQRFGDSIVKKYNLSPAFEQSWRHESGNRVITYSSGMAVLYLPFFAAGHIIAHVTGYPADGFSLPYQLAIASGCLLAALLGLWYFRKLLLRYYNDKVTAVVLFVLVVGTNYLDYSTVDGNLTHNWLFTCYVLLILNTIHFYRQPDYKYAIRVGLLYGLMILIRPSEIIAIVIPAFWGMENMKRSTVAGRWRFIKAHKKMILTAIVCTVAVGIIQVAYWLYVTGKPLVYSYREQGFSWLRPHVWNYVFSYKSGWAVYTPMVLLMLVAFVPFVYKGKNRVAVLLFSAVSLYIVTAWDIWWYGGTGGRAMMQYYPVMMFAFASMIEVVTSRRVLRIVMGILIVVFSYFNIWFTWQAHITGGVYDPDAMSESYFWAVAGRWRVPEDVKKLKTTDELFTGEPRDMKLVYENDFEMDTAVGAKEMPAEAIEGRHSEYVDVTHEYSSRLVFEFSDRSADWIRVEGTFRIEMKEWVTWKIPQFIASFKNGEKVIKSKGIRVSYFLEDWETQQLYIDVKVPHEDFDKVEVLLWNPGSEFPVLYDRLRVYSFKEERRLASKIPAVGRG